MNGDESQEQADMLTLHEAISRAAPTPPDGLQARIAARILQSASSAAPGKQGSTRRRFAIRRAAALLLGIFIVGTGVAFAISTALQQFIAQDDGLAAIIAQGRGHEIGLSQTINGFTVTLDWAYADGNRLNLAYTIQGQSGGEYTNLISDSNVLTLRASGIEIPMIQSMNGMPINSSGEYLHREVVPVFDRSLSVTTYDLSMIPPQDPPELDLRFEVRVYGVTVQQRTQMPMEQFDAMKKGPDEVFVLDFTLPLDGEQRVFNTPLTATDNDISLTLQRVVVTPSQVRFVLCLVPPAPDRKWTAIPHLTANGGDVAGGGAVDDIANVGEAANQSCMQYLYNAGMYDYRDEWRLEITELVGFGSGGGNDQQRIAGSWVFEFTVP
jgi:hypothetical protein